MYYCRIIILILFSTISAQSSATISEVFFLDLGIVIEHSTGDEEYNRIVEAPSEEVNFQIKKAKSGSIYMAASKEMLASLERINNRIATLENSFQEKLFDLQQENQLLKNMIADINNPPKMADETQNSINATVDEPTNLLEVQLESSVVVQLNDEKEPKELKEEKNTAECEISSAENFLEAI